MPAGDKALEHRRWNRKFSFPFFGLPRGLGNWKFAFRYECPGGCVIKELARILWKLRVVPLQGNVLLERSGVAI